MAVRRATRIFGWRSVYELYYDNALDATPTSDGAGTCTFDFGVDRMRVSNWINTPSATGMAYGLFAFKTLSVTDNASWTDGTTRMMFVFAGLIIWAKKSGSNWVIYTTWNDTTTLIEESATARSFSTNYGIAVSVQHASPYRCRVWIDDTLDIDGNTDGTGSTNATIQICHTAGTANGSMTVGEGYVCYSDTDEYIDASTISVLEMVTAADGTDTGWTVDETGDPGTSPYEDSIDEDPPDGNTTFVQSGATASTTYRQTFTTSNVSLSNVVGIMIAHQGRNTVNAKTIEVFTISRDGSVREEATHGSLVSDAFTDRVAVFTLAPDTGAWTQTDLDALEIGIRATIGADTVAYRVSAMHCEAAGSDFIANAVTATPRSRTYGW